MNKTCQQLLQKRLMHLIFGLKILLLSQIIPKHFRVLSYNKFWVAQKRKIEDGDEIRNWIQIYFVKSTIK